MIQTVSITDLKQNTSGVVNRVRTSKEPILVIQNSEPAAVIVDPNHYESLEEAFEDLLDLRSIKETEDEPTISLEEYYKKRFGKKLPKR